VTCLGIAPPANGTVSSFDGANGVRLLVEGVSAFLDILDVDAIGATAGKGHFHQATFEVEMELVAELVGQPEGGIGHHDRPMTWLAFTSSGT